MTANDVLGLIDQIFAWIAKITGWALLLLAAAMTAQAFGIRLPMIPAIAPQTAVYLGGFWYLIRK